MEITVKVGGTAGTVISRKQYIFSSPSRESFYFTLGDIGSFFMAIYTRTGDKGKTSLFSGKRVWKDNLRVETYGSLDEVNSIIGVSIANLKLSNKKIIHLKNLLIDIQRTLFYVNSYLAGLYDAIDSIDLNKKIEIFEKEIDEMTQKVPKLSNFILPGGGTAGANLQHARAVARRAERLIVKLSRRERVDERAIKYINRLSDFLFTASRFANFIEKKKERIWSR